MLALSSVWRIVCDAGGLQREQGRVFGVSSLWVQSVVVQRPLAGFTLADPLLLQLRLSSRPLFLILGQQDAPEVLANVRGEVDQQIFFAFLPFLFFAPLSLL